MLPSISGKGVNFISFQFRTISRAGFPWDPHDVESCWSADLEQKSPWLGIPITAKVNVTVKAYFQRKCHTPLFYFLLGCILHKAFSAIR